MKRLINFQIYDKDIKPYRITAIIHHRGDDDYWIANLNCEYPNNKNGVNNNMISSTTVFTDIERYDVDWKTLVAILVKLGFPKLTKADLKYDFHTKSTYDNDGGSTYYKVINNKQQI